MFDKSSRYATTPTVEALDAEGREVTAVKLRRLPETAGAPLTVAGADRLDVIAARSTATRTRFWHIADANTELDAARPADRRSAASSWCRSADAWRSAEYRLFFDNTAGGRREAGR